jgi:hypothetical protein
MAQRDCWPGLCFVFNVNGETLELVLGIPRDGFSTKHAKVRRMVSKEPPDIVHSLEEDGTGGNSNVRVTLNMFELTPLPPFTYLRYVCNDTEDAVLGFSVWRVECVASEKAVQAHPGKARK